MKKKSCASLLFCLGLCSLSMTQRPRMAEASVLVKLSVEELVSRADYSLVGTVEGLTSYFWGGGNSIVTDVRIRCTQEVFGVPVGSVFVVRHLGGETGKIGQKVFGEASYRVGEEVLLLAEKRNGAFFSVGMAQGVMHIKRDQKSGERRIFVHLSGAELQGGAAVNKVASTDGENADVVISKFQRSFSGKPLKTKSESLLHGGFPITKGAQ